jgi:hypothetical protein
MIVACYYLSLILLLPGAFIALFFLAVGRVAGQGTLGQFLAAVWDGLGWLYSGGFLVVAAALVALVSLVAFLLVGGGLPRTRPYAAALVLVLAAASLATTLRIGGMPKIEELFIPLCSAGSIVVSAVVLWQSVGTLAREAP